MYRSILDKRERPVEAEDFADVPALMFNQYVADERMGQESLILWNRYIPYQPFEIYDLLTGGYGRDDLLLKVNAYESGLIEFQIDHGREESFVSRIAFKMGKTPRVEGTKIEVARDCQGQGVGRICLRNQMELAGALGFEEFTFEAGLEGGGYTWAKMGANIDRNPQRHPDYAVTDAYLSQSLLARLEAARPYLSRSDYGEARALCRITNSDDLVRLSDMGDVRVPKDVLDVSNERIHAFFTSIEGDTHNCLVRIREEQHRIVQIFNDASYEETYSSLSLPRYLQKWTSWPAVIDFSNDRQMQRIEDYVGGLWTMERVREPVFA